MGPIRMSLHTMVTKWMGLPLAPKLVMIHVMFNAVACVFKPIPWCAGKDQIVEHASPTFYGVIIGIWELDYNNFRIPIFRCNWIDMNRGTKVDDLGYTLVNLNKLGFFNDPFVLAKHVKQVCYIDDPLDKTMVRGVEITREKLL